MARVDEGRGPVWRRSAKAGKRGSTRHTAGILFAAVAAMGGLAGCGNSYRPVVSAINPVGPASQPIKFAIAVSNTSSTLAPNQAGLVTFVDVSGDTILSTPSIVQNPSYFGIDFSGTFGYALNSAGVFENFALNNPTALITSDIIQTQLAANAAPVSVSAFTVGGSSDIFVPEPGLSQVAVLANPGSPSLLQSLAVGANPVYVVGADGTSRAYAISQGAAGSVGTVAAIEGTPISISATIPVDITPVYGVMTPDARRAFILNKRNKNAATCNTLPGSPVSCSTVSVINVVNNALDNTTPTIALPNIAFTGGTAAANPVWADLSPRVISAAGNNQLVVLNQGDGVHPGSLSIIDIPLCNASAQATNPNCNQSNPVDATGFGRIFATPTVGVNPVMVSILQDGSRAYVVNRGYKPGENATFPNGLEGSVSVVSLTSGLVLATIPASSTGDTTQSSSMVYGHPETIAATIGTPTGKVYITSSDSRYLSVLRTDLDAVDTHVPLQGFGVRVLVNQP